MFNRFLNAWDDGKLWAHLAVWIVDVLLALVALALGTLLIKGIWLGW